MKLVLSLLTFCLFCSSLFAQAITLTGQKTNLQRSALVDQSLVDYAIQDLNVDHFFEFLEQQNTGFQLKLQLAGEKTMLVDLHKTNLVAPNCLVRVAESDGQVRNIEQPAIYTLQGTIAGEKNSAVAITVARDFLYAYLETADKTRFIEPAYPFDKNLGINQYLVYDGKSVRENPNFGCGILELEHQKETMLQESDSEADACAKLVEVAIASDYSMVLRYGTIQEVLNHNIALINASEVNFSAGFSSVVLFSVVSQFVSSCVVCDPWTTSGDQNALFNSFMSWANMGGFGPVAFDLGHFRTTRSITSNNVQVIGASALGGVCKSFKYSIFSELAIMNFGNLRKTTSHEIGHSFGATHSTGIMQQGISSSNVWADMSILEINIGLANATCINPVICTPMAPANPDGLRYICSWGEFCYNYNSNPCNQTYSITTNDPDLLVTVDGTRVCLKALTPGPRVSTLLVTAINYCGISSTQTATWHVQIDPLLYCDQFRPAAPVIGTAENFQFTLLDETLTLLDNAIDARTKLVQVYDMSGKMLVEQTCDSDLNTISLQGLPAGILIARAIHGKEVLTSKIFHQ